MKNVFTIKKRLLILLILLIFVVGCSQDTADEESVAEPTSSEVETAEPMEEATTEPVATEVEEMEESEEPAGTVKIGLLTAMTGSGAVYGIEIDKGTQLAIDILNENGGVAGYILELHTEDHVIDPEKAVAGYQKLVNIDGVHLIISSFTNPTLAIQPVAAEQSIPILNPVAPGGALVGLEALFNSVPNRNDTYPRLVKYVVEDVGAQRIASIFWSDEAGRNVNDIIINSCATLGCEVVVEEPAEVGATDFGTQVARVKAANPDSIILGVWGDDLGYAIRELYTAGVDLPRYAGDFTENALEIAGVEAFEGYKTFQLLYDPAYDPDAAEFATAYEEVYGEIPTRFGANQWEAVMYFVVPLIERAVENGDDPTEIGVLLDTMNELIDEEYAFDSIYGDKVILYRDGTVDKGYGVYEVKNGALELLGTVGVED